MYYAVIDTNVFVSAFLSRKNLYSAPVQILRYVFDKKISPIFNEKIIEEYVEVLNRSKFNFSSEDITELIGHIKKFGIHEDILVSEEKFTDESDRVFFEITLSHLEKNSSTWLVTGNLKHFPQKKFVVTPREMVNIIESK